VPDLPQRLLVQVAQRNLIVNLANDHRAAGENVNGLERRLIAGVDARMRRQRRGIVRGRVTQARIRVEVRIQNVHREAGKSGLDASDRAPERLFEFICEPIRRELPRKVVRNQVPADDGMNGDLGDSQLMRVLGHRLKLIQILVHRDETEVQPRLLGATSRSELQEFVNAPLQKIQRAESIDPVVLPRVHRVQGDRQPIQTAFHDAFEHRPGDGRERRYQFRRCPGPGRQTDRFQEPWIMNRLARVVQADEVRRLQLANQPLVDVEVQVRTRSKADPARAEDTIEGALRSEFDPERLGRGRRDLVRIDRKCGGRSGIHLPPSCPSTGCGL